MLFSFRTNEHNQMQPKKHNTKVHYPCTARLIKNKSVILCNFALLAPSEQVSESYTITGQFEHPVRL